MISSSAVSKTMEGQDPPGTQPAPWTRARAAIDELGSNVVVVVALAWLALLGDH
jgi:hypothetical protein